MTAAAVRLLETDLESSAAIDRVDQIILDKGVAPNNYFDAIPPAVDLGAAKRFLCYQDTTTGVSRLYLILIEDVRLRPITSDKALVALFQVQTATTTIAGMLLHNQLELSGDSGYVELVFESKRSLAPMTLFG